jgi:hypothetical protein
MPSSRCEQTHHHVGQIGDSIDKRPDTLVVGLRVNGAGRRANGQTPRALLGVDLHTVYSEGPKAVTVWEEGVPLKRLPFFDDEHARPKNSRKCRASIIAVLTWWDTRFWMSRSNASKRGIWPSWSSLMLSLDALLADIILGCGNGGMEGEGFGGSVCCCVLCDV